jgi:hypothetical protein
LRDTSGFSGLSAALVPSLSPNPQPRISAKDRHPSG